MFCPFCGAKRATAFAAFLVDEVLEPVGHAMWTFSLPKMIRPYFIHHPELRGKPCRASFETVQEMMAAAAVGSGGFRTGMVAVMATAGDLLNPNAHVHAIVPRGGWDEDGRWVPVPYLDLGVVEGLFRGKVLRLLKTAELLSDERIQMLMSWNHNSGFSVDDSVRVEPEDEKAMERMARYMVRPPLSLQRMHYEAGADEVVYSRKTSNGATGAVERFDALDFLARVLSQIQEPGDVLGASCSISHRTSQ